ncbi:hypothetical protein Tco_1097411, partial [Tanacetum coccineum]
MEMANPPEIFDAKVSLRSKMYLLSNIKAKLDDYDAVRVCLLVVKEIVFMGCEEFLNVPLHILTLVEDLFAWDAYPWGEYMWTYFYQRTLNVVPKHVEMNMKCKNQSGKKMATYNLNGFVWALKIWILESYPNSMLWWTKKPDIIPRGLAWLNCKKFEKTDYHRLLGPPSIPILELTPTNEELKETWLIRSLSYIKGEDAPFIQAIKPFQNVDEAPIVNEQSVEIDEQAGAVDDHDPDAPTDSNNLLEDVDSLFKEVIDVRPDLVGRVDELRTKLVQTITSNPLRATPCDDSLNRNESNGKPLDCYYQESQQGSLQNLVKALERELEPDVSCLQAKILDEARFDDAVKDNDEMEHAMDVDNEDGKYCLDDM